jgi:ribosome-binding protein aMBF1 (putative translation factor)
VIGKRRPQACERCGRPGLRYTVRRDGAMTFVCGRCLSATVKRLLAMTPETVERNPYRIVPGSRVNIEFTTCFPPCSKAPHCCG